MNTIYCVWTGTNEMSENRKRCLEQLKKSIRMQCSFSYSSKST